MKRAFARRTRRNSRSSRGACLVLSFPDQRHSAAKVLMKALQTQVLNSNVSTHAQKAAARGYGKNIVFLSAMKGLWKSVGVRVYRQYEVPKEYYDPLLDVVLQRMMVACSELGKVEDCLAVCSWVLKY